MMYNMTGNLRSIICQIFMSYLFDYEKIVFVEDKLLKRED